MDIGQSLDEDEAKPQKCVSRVTNEGAGGLWLVAGCKKVVLSSHLKTPVGFLHGSRDIFDRE